MDHAEGDYENDEECGCWGVEDEDAEGDLIPRFDETSVFIRVLSTRHDMDWTGVSENYENEKSYP